jgi:hypothetical protein
MNITLRILFCGALLALCGCHIWNRENVSNLSQERFGGGCNTLSVGIFSADKVPLSKFKLPDFCASPTDANLKDLVIEIRQELLAERSVRVKIQCDGNNGTNQFILLDSIIIGYRKICDSLTGRVCRHEYKVEDIWKKENEVFSQACANKMK